MSDLKIEITQILLSVAATDSGATLSIEELPPSVASSIRFEVRSLEGERDALRHGPHPIFRRMRSQGTREITSYLNNVFVSMDWLKPGLLHPIDPSRIHPTPPDGEKWSGYFVNLIMPRGSSEPHLSVHFLQRHKLDVPELTVEMLISLFNQSFEFATNPAKKADSN
jgi:hypothetical protein